MPFHPPLKMSASAMVDPIRCRMEPSQRPMVPISTLDIHNGCDSIITTNLTVTDAYSITLLSPSICDGDALYFARRRTTTSSGIFSFTFVSAAGCDSIVTVDLTVNAVSSTTEDVSICDGGSTHCPMAPSPRPMAPIFQL